MLDVIGTAFILLDEAGHVVYMNQPARMLALEEDGLRVCGDRISPTHSFQIAAFQTLVAAARQNGRQGAIALARRSERRSLNVLVSPFNRVNRCLSTARVSLLVTDPESVVNFPDDIFRALYDLTPAETEIANGLLTGFSLEDIAKLRKTALTTIRSQLKTLLGKTKTRRQAELIWLLASLPTTTEYRSFLVLKCQIHPIGCQTGA
ncbi:MAG: hypothetical protein M3O31_14180 [Acidobacteriota bacterium]|nr:hypothetical protein [Acidobacteriota bacterium]